MQLRYSFRVYPTAGQQQSLARAFGCARVVFNDGLRARQEARENGLPYVSDGDLSKRVITEAKKTEARAWLGEVSAVVLQQALADLNTAYRNFFHSLSGKRKGRKVAPPRFRSRKDNRQAIRFTANARFKVLGNGRLRLPKIGDLSVRWSRPLPSAPTSVTIVRDAAGRYFASFVVTMTQDETLPPVESEVGIDLGLTHFAVLSDGSKVAAPKFLRRAARKLKRLQQGLARKQKGSANRRKAVVKVARAHARVADTRRDWHHKLSTTTSATTERFVEDLCCCRARPDPAGQVGARRRLGAVHRHVGVQGRPVRAHLRPRGPLVPLHPHVFAVRGGQQQGTAERPVVDVPLRGHPRPGHQRRTQHQGRRTGGPQRPWSADKTRSNPGTARRSGNPPEAHTLTGVADRNPLPSGKGGRQENGVLTLRIPVAERAKPRKISIMATDNGRKQINA